MHAAPPPTHDGPDPLFTDDAGRGVPIRTTAHDQDDPDHPRESLGKLARRWWIVLLLAAILTAFATPHVARAFALPRELAALLCLAFLAAIRVAPHQARGLIAVAGPIVVAIALFLRGGFGNAEWLSLGMGAFITYQFVVVLRAALSRTPVEPAPRDIVIPRIAAALRTGRCASCGYNLEGVLSVDGLTRCPECAAAWRLDTWRDQFPTPRVPKLHPTRTTPGLFGGSRTLHRVATARLDADNRPICAPLLAARPAPEVEQRIRANRRAVGFLAWLYFTIAAAMVIAVLAGFWASDWDWRLNVPMLFAILAIVGAGVLTARRSSLVAVQNDLLRHNRCPCCEAPLPIEPTSIDRVRLCRTCGHAWREPHGNPEPPPAAKGPQSQAT